MQIGMVGLGRMGANMVRRLLKQGHECVVYDVNADNVDALVKEGATGALSPGDLIAKLEAPRARSGSCSPRRSHQRLRGSSQQR